MRRSACSIADPLRGPRIRQFPAHGSANRSRSRIRPPSCSAARADRNVLMVGQQEEQAMAAIGIDAHLHWRRNTVRVSGLLHPRRHARRFPIGRTFALSNRNAAAQRSTRRMAGYRRSDQRDCRGGTAARKAIRPAGPIFVFVYGLQRYRILRREDDFSLSMTATNRRKPTRQSNSPTSYATARRSACT